jgi:glycerol kinase
MSILVIDVGSSAARASVIRPDGTVAARRQEAVPAQRPMPGLVEQDGTFLARAVIEVARSCLAEGGPVDGVGITNQRGTTMVWDAGTGEPIGPALSWQDLRTAGTCLELQAEGLRLAPNESATKLAWLLDTYDPERRRDLRFGTLDTWVIWQLSGGRAHVTDQSNAAITGLLATEAVLAGTAPIAWDSSRLERFRVPEACMPAIVSSSGTITEASSLPGAPPICGIAGDQQASLMGQGCVRPGDAKGTFGTGAFLDVNVGGTPPRFVTNPKRGDSGCFPIIAWQRDGATTWGVEGIMLSAGAALSWLVDELGLLANVAESADVAGRCADTGDVFYVPAQIGLGTPHWDFGARSLLIGMSAETGRPELVRAVLRGIAHRGADMLEAAESDSGHAVSRLRADGGMTANPVFVQELADACRRPVEISAELEATSLGAAFLAGLSVGTWSSLDDVAAVAQPRLVVEPAGPDRRGRWKEALSHSRRWIPELSALDF